jgi:hypothetical protein
MADCQKLPHGRDPAMHNNFIAKRKRRSLASLRSRLAATAFEFFGSLPSKAQ